jgi:hypothetical protein
MQTLEQIRDKYKTYGRRGDWQLVANKLGKSRDLVRKVVQGKRKNKAVLAAVVKLLDIREAGQKDFLNA